MDIKKETTCCFIGHRKIEETKELRERLYKTLEWLITERKIDTFLFGSRSQFNDLCLKMVTELKEKYSHIARIYVRAEFPFISDSYRDGLLKRYEETYYPEKIMKAGKFVYVERNYEMIEKSVVCVAYYDKEYLPPTRRRNC